MQSNLWTRKDKIKALRDLAAGKKSISSLFQPSVQPAFQFEVDGPIICNGRELTKEQYSAYVEDHPNIMFLTYVQQPGNEPLPD